MAYFGEISKIMKSKMEPLIPTIVEVALDTINAEIGLLTKEKEAGAPTEFDLDSDQEDDEVIGLDLQDVDEKSAAIGVLGHLCLNCSGIMQPHMEKICEALKTAEAYVHQNVRYHVALTYTQISFGLLRLHTGNTEVHEPQVWKD
jgi:uncharacterized protein with von Willebrand factor type A (vWA) domain